MAKDPAFLFYSADFMIGTALFNQEQRGKYISLLCYQHQLGHLKEADLLTICGGRDEMILSKFKQDDKGLYYNERLEDESDKRRAFCLSRRNNASSTSKAYASHMENENDNENEDRGDGVKKGIVKGKKFVPPTADEVRAYCQERRNKVDPQTFIDFYITNGWVQGRGKPVKDWKACVRTWENRQGEPYVQKKRPAFALVMEYRVLKWPDREITDKLLELKYSEHEINEAMGKKY